ncbi:MAG: TIGR02234 family membrane protein [Actinomycetota bacterium]|uniref:TIGR02234 family membrane protein n=1 Tax=Mycobacterium lentiflavum TaxID=141349 RepID=A0ABY3UYC6_MYCLN|nr:TIGR02234 family membrane protein [Mycobacterium lentiflavum]MEE3063037.1 TIGR02234 family membrane protein [Actinomycetota bacterium]ULP44576.1 TIGR02234 family membrane protein [Mycobacterium lentiflavum]
MADAPPDRRARLTIGLAQLLLVIAAGLLWTASRLPWVVIRSFDGLGPPREVILAGASWSTVLLPSALLLLATAVAALAVRGWALRALAGLLAVISLAIGYLGVSLWVLPDVAVRGSELAHISLLTLVGSERRYAGAGFAVGAAVCTLIAAVLLMRSAMTGGAKKYAAPATRRSIARREGADGAMLEEPGAPEMSERMIWDALDEGHDPTDRPRESDTEGR